MRQRAEQNGYRKGKSGETVDPNASEILPTSIAEKEQRRQQMKAQLRTEQPKISGKKQKRLDKYVVCKIIQLLFCEYRRVN